MAGLGNPYVFPVPRGVHWSWSRTDAGVDIETGSSGVGKPLVAIGNARITHITDAGEYGPSFLTYQLLDGPYRGRYVFVGHSGPPLVHVGQIVAAGQPIIRIHGGSYGGPPGHFEIGWGTAGGGTALAWQLGTARSGDHFSPQGAAFKRLLEAIQGNRPLADVSGTADVGAAGGGGLDPIGALVGLLEKQGAYIGLVILAVLVGGGLIVLGALRLTGYPKKEAALAA